MPDNENNIEQQKNTNNPSMANALAETTLAFTAIGASEGADAVKTVFESTCEDAWLGKIGGKAVSAPLKFSGYSASYVRNLSNTGDHKKAFKQTGKDIVFDEIKSKTMFTIMGNVSSSYLAMVMAIVDAASPMTDALANRVDNPLLKTVLQAPGNISNLDNAVKEFIMNTDVQIQYADTLRDVRSHRSDTMKNDNIRPSIDDPDPAGIIPSILLETLLRAPKAVADFFSDQTTNQQPDLEKISIMEFSETKNITDSVGAVVMTNTSTSSEIDIFSKDSSSTHNIDQSQHILTKNASQIDTSGSTNNGQISQEIPTSFLKNISNQTQKDAEQPTASKLVKEPTKTSTQTDFSQGEKMLSDLSIQAKTDVAKKQIFSDCRRESKPPKQAVNMSAGLSVTQDGKPVGYVSGTASIGKNGSTVAFNATTAGVVAVGVTVPLSSTAVAATGGAAVALIAIGLIAKGTRDYMHAKKAERAAHVPYFLTFDRETNEQLGIGLFKLSKGNGTLSNRQRQRFEKKINAARKIANTPEKKLSLDFLADLINKGPQLKSYLKDVFGNDALHTIQDDAVTALLQGQGYDSLITKASNVLTCSKASEIPSVEPIVAQPKTTQFDNNLQVPNVVKNDSATVYNEPNKNNTTEEGAAKTSQEAETKVEQPTETPSKLPRIPANLSEKNDSHDFSNMQHVEEPALIVNQLNDYTANNDTEAAIAHYRQHAEKIDEHQIPQAEESRHTPKATDYFEDHLVKTIEKAARENDFEKVATLKNQIGEGNNLKNVRHSFAKVDYNGVSNISRSTEIIAQHTQTLIVPLLPKGNIRTFALLSCQAVETTGKIVYGATQLYSAFSDFQYGKISYDMIICVNVAK